MLFENLKINVAKNYKNPRYSFNKDIQSMFLLLSHKILLEGRAKELQYKHTSGTTESINKELSEILTNIIMNWDIRMIDLFIEIFNKDINCAWIKSKHFNIEYGENGFELIKKKSIYK